MECGRIFDEPRCYVETHGLDTPPYEVYYGCPKCAGSYAEAYKCDECNKWIDGSYIKTTLGQRICENCYSIMEIGDEDDKI